MTGDTCKEIAFLSYQQPPEDLEATPGLDGISEEQQGHCTSQLE
jgi:hypothetical protein